MDGLQRAIKQVEAFLNSPTGQKEIEKGELLFRRNHLIWLLIDIAEQAARPDGWTPIAHAGQLIRQEVPQEISSIKKFFGYNSLKAFILEAKIFEVYEEPTEKGHRTMYRKKPTE